MERKKKDCPLKGKIIKVTCDHVVVYCEESASEVVVELKSFLRSEFVEYKVHTVEEIPWEEHSAARSSEVQRQVMHAKVVQAIEKVCKKYSKSWSALAMWPAGQHGKCMKAKRDIEPDELTLVPITLSVNVFKPGSKKDLERNVWLGDVKGFAVTLSPCSLYGKDKKDKDDQQQQKEGFINPFWLVTSVENAEEVNLKVKWEPLVGTGLHIPLYVNCRKIAAGERIHIRKGEFPSKSSFESKLADAEDVGEPPKKRSK